MLFAETVERSSEKRGERRTKFVIKIRCDAVSGRDVLIS